MPNTTPQPFSYAQILILALAPAIGLGMARFGYALLLPAMRSELDWSYSEAGWMNTANAIGYLMGALITAALARRIGLWLLLQIGVIASAMSIVLTGVTDDFYTLSALRFFSGVFGALCLVGGGAVAAIVANQAAHRSEFALSLFYVGPGIGIAISGLAVPAYMDRFTDAAWPSAWVGMGAIAAILAWLFLHTEKPDLTRHDTQATQKPPFRIKQNLPVLISYTAFGAGYIGYMTFMFTHLQQSGATVFQLTMFWMTIGVSAISAPWVWRNGLGQWTRAYAIAFLSTITLIGAAIPLFGTAFPVLVTSAVVFGLSFFSVTAATTAFVKRNASSKEWPFVIGLFTTCFGLGQVIGPVLAGLIADHTGSLSIGLMTGCALLLFAAVISLLQTDAPRKD